MSVMVLNHILISLVTRLCIFSLALKIKYKGLFQSPLCSSVLRARYALNKCLLSKSTSQQTWPHGSGVPPLFLQQNPSSLLSPELCGLSQQGEPRICFLRGWALFSLLCCLWIRHPQPPASLLLFLVSPCWSAVTRRQGMGMQMGEVWTSNIQRESAEDASGRRQMANTPLLPFTLTLEASSWFWADAGVTLLLMLILEEAYLSC